MTATMTNRQASGLQVRPITSADLPLLAAIYASTRAEELRLTNWTPEQRTTFLQQQFAAQHQHYLTAYPAANFGLILLDTTPIGRLYLNRGTTEYRIIDIALLPPYRRQGWGRTLLRQIQAEAAQVKLPVTIHVERFNPALRLYQRLGFQLREDKGVYLLLGWQANQQPASGENRLIADSFLSRIDWHQEKRKTPKIGM